MSARTFVVGDIHGCDTALRLLLEQLQLVAGDTLVLLGDVIDRGPGTREVIHQLLELRAVCEVVLICGNHEEVFLEGLAIHEMNFWLMIGGAAVVESYGGDWKNMPEEHLAFLHNFVNYHETETDCFVHASVRLDRPFHKQTTRDLCWECWHEGLPPHYSGKRILCGHTRQPSGLPAVSPGWVCLDTGACCYGYLSALDVEANIVYQTSERGECRQFPLDEMPTA